MEKRHVCRLEEELRQKKILVAAHRGTCGGNIVPNTAAACKNAILHEADIIELDAAMSTNGDFFAFHDGEEAVALGVEQNIRTMSTAEVESLRLRNSLGKKCHAAASRLADVLLSLRGCCLINIDRSWFYWPAIFGELLRLGMNDQLIIKSPPLPEYLRELETHAPEMMYMPICTVPADIEAAMDAKVNTVAAELIFTDEGSELVSDAAIARMRGRGWVLWANAITLDDDTTLSAHHDDNHAILRDMDESWGWLVRKGFEIIQTDWPMPLRKYLRGMRGM